MLSSGQRCCGVLVVIYMNLTVFGLKLKLARKSSVPKDNQKSKLKTAYETAVNKIFNTPANPQASGNNVVPVADNPPAGKQLTTPPTAPATPQNEINTPQQPAPPPTDGEQKPLAIVPPLYNFKIKSVTPSGKGSQLLELCDNNSGEIMSAYVKSGVQGIAVGASLQDVRLEERTGTYGKYNLIASYKAA
jgi:hypothetical protein